MKKSLFLIISLCCIAAVLASGCIMPKDMGTVTIPTTITGHGPAIVKFVSSEGSHMFHATSVGDHAGMIITIDGMTPNSKGETWSAYIVQDPNASGGIDVSKNISGFVPDSYSIEVMTVNPEAPWSIQIQ